MSDALDKTSSLYRSVKGFLASARNQVTGYGQSAGIINRTVIDEFVGAAPVSNFTYSIVDHPFDPSEIIPYEPTINDIIEFEDLSINIPTSWVWKMSVDGGGFMQFSTEQDATLNLGTIAGEVDPPITEFSGGESIAISLTVTNAYGTNTKLQIPLFILADGLIEE